MAIANTKDLVALVDSADDEGFVHFRIFDGRIRTLAQARDWLLTMFMHAPWVILRLERVKKAITELNLEILPGDECVFIKLNLAKLLQLPGLAPADELAAFRAMLLEMRLFFEKHPTKRVNIQLCNNRDNHRKVYGTAVCRVPLDDTTKVAVDEDATAALGAVIYGHLALSAWLDNMALTLQKIGPWAQACIQEEELFGILDGPFSKYLSTLPPPPVPSPENIKELRVLDI